MSRKVHISLLALLLLGYICLGQERTGEESLSHRITRLETFASQLQGQERQNLISRIHYEYEILYYLDVSTHSLLTNLNIVQSYNLLAQVNNPTSDVLGFRFLDIIMTTIRKRLEVPKPEQSRFSRLLSNIAAGFRTLEPVITRSSPTLSLFSTILASVANFFIPSRKGSQVTGLEPAFSEDQIQAFTEDIRPYINFYERMYRYNLHLQEDLTQLHKEVTHFRGRIQELSHHAENTFGFSAYGHNRLHLREWVSRNLSDRQDSLRPGWVETSIELKAIADQVRDLDRLHRRFDILIGQNLEMNLILLEEAGNLPVFIQNQADPAKLKTLREELAKNRELFLAPANSHIRHMRELAVWLVNT